MTNQVWAYLSNMWDAFLDKGLIEVIWSAYEDIFTSIRRDMFQANLSKGIHTASSYSLLDWAVFKLSESNYSSEEIVSEDPEVKNVTYTIFSYGAVEIAQIQDGIDTPDNTYADGVDYTTSGGDITWLNVTEDNPVPTDIELWAVGAKFYGTSISDNFGVLVGEEQENSDSYLAAIKGITMSYWAGPSIRSIRNGLNVIIGGGYHEAPGIISFFEDGKITVNLDDGTISVIEVPSGEVSAFAIGERVEKFDLLTDTVDVLDYIKNPRWWDRYGVGMIDNSETVFSSAEDIEEFNQIAKRFIWAVKIDGDKYATLASNVAGMLNRFLENIEPSYTNHVLIVSNDFYSPDRDPDKGDFLEFEDDYDGDDDLEVTIEIGCESTISFNEVSNLMYNEFAMHNLGYHEYHTEKEYAYDLDSDVLIFTEELDILET